jgi:broad specificity phosphatase PhoE
MPVLLNGEGKVSLPFVGDPMSWNDNSMTPVWQHPQIVAFDELHDFVHWNPERAYQVVQRVRAISGNVLIFSSRDFIRVLAAQWLELGPACGRYFMLKPSSLSALSYEHILSEPVIQFWNDDHQVHASQS